MMPLIDSIYLLAVAWIKKFADRSYLYSENWYSVGVFWNHSDDLTNWPISSSVHLILITTEMMIRSLFARWTIWPRPCLEEEVLKKLIILCWQPSRPGEPEDDCVWCEGQNSHHSLTVSHPASLPSVCPPCCLAMQGPSLHLLQSPYSSGHSRVQRGLRSMIPQTENDEANCLYW